MRKIDLKIVSESIEKLFIDANYILPNDVRVGINNAIDSESNPLSKKILNIVKDNYNKSDEMVYPLCQDTDGYSFS